MSLFNGEATDSNVADHATLQHLSEATKDLSHWQGGFLEVGDISDQAILESAYELDELPRSVTAPSLKGSHAASEALLLQRSDSWRQQEGPDLYRSNNAFRRQRYLSGWRRTVTGNIIVAGCVLLVNVVLTIWAASRYGFDGGYGILYDGSCDTGRNLSTALHILINVLSTLLLSASNYCMQCLTSPTRLEVDHVHAQKEWVDIGVPSWRNRQIVSRKNITLWWILVLSSVPLHFVYNSVVFLDKSAQDISASWRLIDAPPQVANTTLLTTAECEQAYNKAYVSNYGDLYLITQSVGDQTLTPENTYFPGTIGVVWNKTTTPYNASTNNGNNYFMVTSCYSVEATEQCKVRFGLSIMLIVIVCNLLKTICMALTLWTIHEWPLVTIGDAIASFLEQPDITTIGLCLLSKADVRHHSWRFPESSTIWEPVRERQWDGANTNRRVIVNWLFCVGLVVPGTIIVDVAANIGVSAFQTGVGFGTQIAPLQVPTLFSTSGTFGIFLNVMLANTPQAIMSFLHLWYNNLLSGVLLGAEWNTFATKRQTLRVTAPSGAQRSSYYLSIPYRYAIPLLVASSVLHWLISESLFLVRVTALNGSGGQDDTHSQTAIGYSPLAMTLAFVLGLVMILAINFRASNRFLPAIPIAASCSAAISAACHPPEDEVDVAIKPVQWGVVQRYGTRHGSWQDQQGVGHCSFSSRLVAPPIPGRRYAGQAASEI
ncbi:hypothetical protein MMC18_007095 [Xylographa bjoerkii]|nr:hypothetical protein [Xylographa bjoerkii]